MFNFVFWAFGFLRMGTTGLTAQALGAGDGDEVRAGLGRAAILALAIGLALIALQWLALNQAQLDTLWPEERQVAR